MKEKIYRIGQRMAVSSKDVRRQEDIRWVYGQEIFHFHRDAYLELGNIMRELMGMNYAAENPARYQLTEDVLTVTYQDGTIKLYAVIEGEIIMPD